MKKKMIEKEKEKEENKLPSSQDALVLFGTLADTTWRVFFPTIGGVVLGIWGDHSFTTKPFLTLIGVVCGTIVSLYLVYRQLQGVKER